MLEHLTRLAHDRAPARRAELLATVIDLYGAAGARAEATLGLVFSDIVVRLLPALAPDEQVGIAMRLAQLPTAPHELIVSLARRPGAVAEALLGHSPVLTESDLVALAAELPEPQLLAVALRRPLAERVTDALVAHGGASLCRAVAANRSARLSPDCLKRIVACCDAGEPADVRPPAEIVAFSAASAPPRRHRRAGTAAVIPWPKPAATMAAAATEKASSPVAEAIAAIASNDRMLEVAMLLAAHAGLPPDLVSRLIARPDPSLLAVLCRAAGVPPATFAVIARIRGRRFGHPLSATLNVEAAYAELTEAEARETLGSVRAMQKGA